MIDSAIPGVTLTAFKKDPAATVIVDVVPDSTALKSKVKDLVTAYNDLVKFATDQSAAAGRGDASIGRDPLLRQLRNQLRSALSAEYPTGGAYTALSQVGVEFTQQGTLKLDEAALDDAVANGTAAVSSLFVGTSGAPGVFAALGSLLDGYNNANGLLPGARKQLSDQATRLNDQISTMQDRLALRRAALQREFTAADQTLSQLKSQSQSLASFGAQL